jgi:hypothetical protein
MRASNVNSNNRIIIDEENQSNDDIIGNNSTRIENRIIRFRLNENIILSMDTRDLPLDYSENEMKGLWNLFQKEGFHHSQFLRFLNNPYIISMVRERRNYQYMSNYSNKIWGRIYCILILIIFIKFIFDY